MIAFRFIAAATLVFLLVCIGALLWQMHSPDAGPLDVLAMRRILRECGYEAECKVKIGDLFDGEWDTFYEFGSGVSQSAVDSVLGPKQARREPLRRLLVMTRNGKVITRINEPDGLQHPLDGEVEFEDERHREEHGVRYDHETWLQVNRYPIDAANPQRGNYYVLHATTQP